MSYTEYRLELIAAAEAWERAAETSRRRGLLGLARVLNEQAIRCRYLSEPDAELEAQFDEAQGDMVRCPHCGRSVLNRPDVRQGQAVVAGMEVGVISVGFRCSFCGHAWGHQDEPAECSHPRMSWGPSGVPVYESRCPDCGVSVRVEKRAYGPDPYLPPVELPDKPREGLT